MKERFMRKYHKISIALLIVALTCLVSIIGIDIYVKMSTIDRIVSVEDAQELSNFDYILVLGAGIMDDGSPSPMLQERLDKGIELYKEGISKKILMSGDHMTDEHDEVNAMKDYAANRGVPPEDIYMDHAGISTYDSIYRLKKIFEAQNVIIVTQKYHLYRSLHIAHMLEIDSYGVDATQEIYSGQKYRELRELAARNKDFVKCLIKPNSSYQGDAIPASADGNYTNDREFVLITHIAPFEGEKSLNTYISSKEKINRLKTVLTEAEYKKETCDCTSNYRIDFDTGQYYDLVVRDDSTILVDKIEDSRTVEATLNEEDSTFIRDLILNK